MVGIIAKGIWSTQLAGGNATTDLPPNHSHTLSHKVHLDLGGNQTNNFCGYSN